ARCSAARSIRKTRPTSSSSSPRASSDRCDQAISCAPRPRIRCRLTTRICSCSVRENFHDRSSGALPGSSCRPSVIFSICQRERPMPRPKTRLCGLVLGLCATLSACTDPGFYTDHREGITFYGGNSVASNVAVQTVDPWPPHASDRHLPSGGGRTQQPTEPHRHDQCPPPLDSNTTAAQYPPIPAAPTA